MREREVESFLFNFYAVPSRGFLVGFSCVKREREFS